MNLPILEFLFQCYFLYKRHTHFSTLSVYTVIFNPIIITWYTLYTTINCTPFYQIQFVSINRPKHCVIGIFVNQVHFGSDLLSYMVMSNPNSPLQDTEWLPEATFWNTYQSLSCRLYWLTCSPSFFTLYIFLLSELMTRYSPVSSWQFTWYLWLPIRISGFSQGP